MSSRFVSAGSAEDNPSEQDEAWRAIQERVRAGGEKQQQQQQQEGKSLYDTLQANKAAKQEAFEESIRLKNQVRALEEDEIEFLDSVRESTRAQEAAVRKDTEQGLEAFRKQQEDAAAKSNIEDPPDTSNDASMWSVGKKRKKAREHLLGSFKLRKSSDGHDEQKDAGGDPDIATLSKPSGAAGESSVTTAKGTSTTTEQSGRPPNHSSVTEESTKPATTKQGHEVVLGLGAYSSDDDG